MTAKRDRRWVLAGGAAVVAAAAGGIYLATRPKSKIGGEHGFGWIPDVIVKRDRHMLSLPFNTMPAPPDRTIDLSPKFPAAYDQGKLNSCVANAIAAAVQFARRAHHKPDDFIPSRLFLYYLIRQAEGTLQYDAGCQLTNGMDVINKVGVCPERDWKYDGVSGDANHKFPPGAKALEQPPASLMQTAQQYHAISSASLDQQQNVLESCLAGGFPFLFGFNIYGDGFKEDTKDLVRPDPSAPMTNRHAVLAVGYDRDRRRFRVRNSWGPDNNDNGYFWMDYAYVLDRTMAKDFWVIYETLKML